MYSRRQQGTMNPGHCRSTLLFQIEVHTDHTLSHGTYVRSGTYKTTVICNLMTSIVVTDCACEVNLIVLKACYDYWLLTVMQFGSEYKNSQFILVFPQRG